MSSFPWAKALERSSNSYAITQSIITIIKHNDSLSSTVPTLPLTSVKINQHTTYFYDFFWLQICSLVSVSFSQTSYFLLWLSKGENSKIYFIFKISILKDQKRVPEWACYKISTTIGYLVCNNRILEILWMVPMWKNHSTQRGVQESLNVDQALFCC